MPSDDTVRNWADGDEQLSRDIARAREVGFDQIAMDALAIADETHRDTKTDDNGNDRPDSEWISRSRLRVETRLKLLAKWDPKRYGEAVTTKLADADGNNLPEVDDVTRATRLAAIFRQVANAPDDAG